MSADDSYAPKSPDLSSFYSSGPTQPAPQQLQHPQAGSHFSPGYEYKAESPTYGRSASFSSYVPPSLPFNNNDNTNDTDHSQQPIPQQHPTQPRSVRSEYQPYSTSQPSAQNQYIYSAPPQRAPSLSSYDGNLAALSLHQPPRPVSYGLEYTEEAPRLSVDTYNQAYAPPSGVGALDPHSAPVAAPVGSSMPPRRAAAPPAPVIEPSPVKTKFPTARIKRIMQADEEVGKVAQQTPIAVGKALELFMIQLVSKSADVAKEKGSKRVTAPMLKQVVETDEQWDFLRDIVSRVENEKEGSKSKAKQDSSSDEEMEEPKKRTRGGRKKKT
ncbi:dna polymerase epsilon subunit c [Fusarium albosuccineum]|uniref:NCT transcriptional regulatory complex subunit A n=1 Tax=Fusarium albosuccineum TaxID=1237068 RepID=A0A8H4LMX8_9HYPO|nr:dna polymerase epsilon subunit c [Fusarium albosuccineum]